VLEVELTGISVAACMATRSDQNVLETGKLTGTSSVSCKSSEIES